MENSQGFKIHDIDIVYRKFSKEDFEESVFSVEEIEVSPNEQGYVSDKIAEVVEEKINEENSIVINAATGQGKTTAVFRAIKRHFETTNDIIIVAVPYKSLIVKYAEKIRSEISEDGVTTMFDLESTENRQLTFMELDRLIGKRIQIVTVNLLLRNPGEFFYQKEVKQRYLDNLISRVRQRNRKLVFIFDEIHAAIYNFNSENIFSFLKFHTLTKKIYYISATYNEASLNVVKTLSRITKFNITLINSKRVRCPQADLHLLMTPKSYSSSDTSNLSSVLFDIISESCKKDEPLNILTYSKELAKSFIGKSKSKNKEAAAVYSIFKELNVANKLKLHVSNSSKYSTEITSCEIDEEDINVGTTFNTGIDITGGTFIIILPDSYLLNESSNNYGIFSDGVNSIIQAIGRMRGNGSIYILMGKPEKLIYPLSTSYINDLDVSGDFRIVNETLSMEFGANSESKLLKRYYDKYYFLNETEINKYEVSKSDKGYGMTLRYPSYFEWVLKEGERFLNSQYLFYGKSLAPIVIWSAIHNQFHNCNLKSLNVLAPNVDFNSDSLLEDCNKFIESEYLEDLGGIDGDMVYSGVVDGLVHKLYSLSDYEILNLLVDDFDKYNIFIDGNQLNYGVNVKLKSKIIQIIGERKKGIKNYNKDNYLLDLISFSKSFDFSNELLVKNTKFRSKQLVELAVQLDFQIDLLYQFLSRRDFIYKEYRSDNLKGEYLEIIKEIVNICKSIKKEDEFISIMAFDLFRLGSIGFIYKQICKHLFNVKEYTPAKRGRNLDSIGTTGQVLELIGRKDYSTLSNGINSFYTYDYDDTNWYNHISLAKL